MLQRIKKLLEHNALLIAIFTTITIAILSLSALPKLNLGFNIKSGDKYLHAFAYFTLSIIWYFVLREKLQKTSIKIIVILSLIMYGIVLEALQNGFTDYRTADFYDVIANTVGVIIATLLFNNIIKLYNTI
jgi:VanZ family protein